MKTTLARKIFAPCLLLALWAVAVWAQPRPAATPAPAQTPAQPAATPKPPPPPANIKAKYEGGVFGYNKKQDGTLQFDEVNRRLIFRTKEGKELLSFNYSNLDLIYPDTKAVRPGAATVVGSIPLPYGANIPAWFVRKKQRYVVFRFSQPGAPAGVPSFKLTNKETALSVVAALCEKAQLRTQGDGCYK
jgi:hypothetical protein